MAAESEKSMWPERKIDTELRRMVDERGPVRVAEEFREILAEIYTHRPDPERKVTVTIEERGK